VPARWLEVENVRRTNDCVGGVLMAAARNVGQDPQAPERWWPLEQVHPYPRQTLDQHGAAGAAASA